jgi:hypothetical protein
MIIIEDQTPKPVKVRITGRWRVTLDDGTAYLPGETAEVPEAVAAHWIKSGWAKKLVNSRPTKDK